MKKGITAITALLLIALYFNGVYAEEKCLNLGNSASECAEVGL